MSRNEPSWQRRYEFHTDSDTHSTRVRTLIPLLFDVA